MDNGSMPKRSHGTGSLFVVGEKWYGRWWIGEQRVKRVLRPIRKPGTSDGLTHGQAERELRHAETVESRRSRPYNCPDMAISASDRFEFRIRPESKQRIDHAAKLVHESASDFVRAAAERRADEVLLEHDVVTIVPAEFFDQLLAALDAEPQPSPALARAGKAARRVVRR
jgi:uncharacterized protein (DUF1778 family)